MVGFCISYRVIFYITVAMLYHLVFFIDRKVFIDDALKTQCRIHAIKGGATDFESLIQRIFNITGLAYIVIITVTEQFGQAAFPKCVNALLVGKLAIVVLCKVQRNMGICYIVPQISGFFQDASSIVLFKGIHQPVILVLYFPWNGAVFI